MYDKLYDSKVNLCFSFPFCLKIWQVEVYTGAERKMFMSDMVLIFGMFCVTLVVISVTMFKPNRFTIKRKRSQKESTEEISVTIINEKKEN